VRIIINKGITVVFIYQYLYIKTRYSLSPFALRMARLFTSLVWLSCILQQPSTAMHQFAAMLRHRSISYLSHERHVGSCRRPRWAQGRTLLTAALITQHRPRIHLHPTRLQSSSSSSNIKTLLPPSFNQFYTEEEIVKKSRFIGIAVPCSSWDEAQLHLEQVRKDHPKSRHVCFGFVSGGSSENSVGTERCSDDGEPTGTAVSSLLLSVVIEAD
jgi:hypothetical protein